MPHLWVKQVNAALKNRGLEINLRVGVPSDVLFFQKVFFLDRGEILPELPHTAKDEVLGLQFEDYQNQIKKHYADAHDFVILDGAIPIGRMLIQVGEQGIHIVEFVMIPALRRRGLGLAIVESFKEMAQKDRLMIEIKLFKDNPALQLFLKAGFSQLKCVHDWVRLKWQDDKAKSAS